jgi:hypothetical protein
VRDSDTVAVREKVPVRLQDEVIVLVKDSDADATSVKVPLVSDKDSDRVGDGVLESPGVKLGVSVGEKVADDDCD